MERNNLLLIILLFFSIQSLHAQSTERRFKAGLMAGGSFSQIDGDLQQGYNKASFSLGIKGGFVIKPNFDISTELFLNQRGTKPKSNESSFSNEQLNTNLNMRYADVMAVGHYYFIPSSDLSYYKQSIQVGLIYGRLLSSSINIKRGNKPETELENTLKQNLRSNDIGLLLGWAWYVNPKWGFMLRHSVSLNHLYDSPTSVKTDKQFADFRPYYLSAHIFFNFISPKLNLEKMKKKAKKGLNPLEEI